MRNIQIKGEELWETITNLMAAPVLISRACDEGSPALQVCAAVGR